MGVSKINFTIIIPVKKVTLSVSCYFAGGLGDASSRVYFPVHAEGESSVSAGGGEEATNCFNPREGGSI